MAHDQDAKRSPRQPAIFKPAMTRWLVNTPTRLRRTKGKPFDRALLDVSRSACQDRAGVRCGLWSGTNRTHLAIAGSTPLAWIFLPDAAQARRLNPDSIRAVFDAAWDWVPSPGRNGRVLFHHSHTAELVVAALSEMRRVLQRGGQLLMAFHLGSEDSHTRSCSGGP